MHPYARSGGFAMDRLQDVIWGEEAFRSLVLGSKQKTLIHSLVKQHKRRAALFDDVVAGKGKGLIGLLSGGPGCGKTLTAEAMAEVTRRPLYVLSAGELGVSLSDLDQNLARVMELSKAWDAILLLDEAEVFLHKRSSTDVNRNALVSIFLRQLEYFQGVLIFTTNMISQCDAAFESELIVMSVIITRVHVLVPCRSYTFFDSLPRPRLRVTNSNLEDILT